MQVRYPALKRWAIFIVGAILVFPREHEFAV